MDEQLEYLLRLVASQNQYLVVKHRDGQKEHIAGYVGVVRLQAMPIIGRKGGA